MAGDRKSTEDGDISATPEEAIEPTASEAVAEPGMVDSESLGEASELDLAATQPKPFSPKVIRIYNAIKILENYCGGSVNAKKLIVDKIQDGEIRAYALHYWTSERQNLKKAWNDGPTPNAPRKLKIRRSTWKASSFIHQEMGKWAWKSGNLWVSHKKSGNKKFRHMYIDVRVVLTDIENLVDAAEARQAAAGAEQLVVVSQQSAVVAGQAVVIAEQSAVIAKQIAAESEWRAKESKVKERHAGGARRQDKAWANLWFVIINILNTEGINKQTFGTSLEFEYRVFDDYEKIKGIKLLSFNTVQDQIQLAYNHFTAKAAGSDEQTPSTLPGP
ncbi:hypothetical protein [Blastomonas fulva]|uniref:hypothetical protein n=1 Tax=Blastomonas fulva TaxID=1550728 RepID=UPI003F7073B7